MKNIGFILQARMSSNRFPGKVMKIINSDPLIFHVINQISYSKYSKNIVIATTKNNEDNIIEKYLRERKIPIFRGSDLDCLDRYYKCAKLHNFNVIVRITCDNPLIDPALIDEVIGIFVSNHYDYVTNCKPRTFPQGTEVEVFSFKALERAWHDAKKPSEREHVTPYFYNNLNKFQIFNVTNENDLSRYRWTVDREEDLEFVKTIYSKIKKTPILMNDILQLIKEQPDLKKINESHIIDEGYLKSVKNDKNDNN